MAGVKADKTVRSTSQSSTSLLQREKRRLKIMQILFAVFCIVLILSLVISLVKNF